MRILGGCILLAGMVGVGTYAVEALPASLPPTNCLMAAALHIPEPFEPASLAAMEKQLQGNLPPKFKVQFAAVLYRYGRKSGEAHLAQELVENHNATAAAVFALNRDEARLDAVLSAFHALPLPRENEHYSPDNAELPLALGKWNHPRVVAALLARQKTNPHSGDVALALARLNVKAAVPVLTRAVAVAKWDSLNTPKLKAALAKLTPEVPRRFEELMRLEQTQKPRTSGYAWSYLQNEAIGHLAYVQEPRLLPVLVERLKKYRPPLIENQLWWQETATEPLMLFETEPAYAALRNIFPHLPASELLPFSLKHRVAGYLYNTRPQADHTFLKEGLGEEALADFKAVQGLRPIPQHLLAFDVSLAELF